ncbi:polysaccharide biosynthesis protein [Mariniluteicoccus flavus]
MGNGLITSDARWRRGSLALWDTFCWIAATFIVVGARYDFELSNVLWTEVLLYTGAAVLLQLVLGWASKVYQGRYRVGSYEEAISLAGIALVTWGVLCVTFIVLRPETPRGLVVLAPVASLLGMAAGRFAMRAILVRHAQGETVAEPVLIYGAGNAGSQLARLLNDDPDAPYEVRGFIDDDRRKRNLHLGRHRVLGNGDHLLAQAAAKEVSTIILAAPTATNDFVRRLADQVEGAGLKLLILPPVQDMVGGRIEVKQLHKVDVADILGRTQVTTDLSEIASYLNGKVVLVTGAGGSIGSEIARQVHGFGPKELVMLDRDESGLHGVQLSIYGKGLLDTPDMVLCDIRDKDALDKIFAFHQPDVVFHAAALKHLPMLEQYPSEGWKTNVLGTLNVLDAARRYGVSHFVNISTDKAADATSVLGKTKRLAEQLTSWYAENNTGTWLSVRFGNVLGSRGSMLHTFTQQIEDGGPVTVTHPDITRYFMTIPEACQLTIQAGAIGEPGDVLVLDMGQPVKILDVANRLVKQSGKDIEIVFTGLRPGEKLHEVLFSETEDAEATSHPLISQVTVPTLAPESLEDEMRLLKRY